MEQNIPVRRLTTNEKSLVDRQVRTLSSAIVARAQLAAGMGSQSYGGNRDIYQALGYKTNLLYKDYEDRYFRQDIAKAIIDRPAKATWQGPLLLEESGEAEETALEKSWKELDNRLGLKTRFQRVDRLSGIGGFGILLLGLDDTKKAEDFKNPVAVGKRKLLYVKPYGEASCSIVEYEMNTKNPRYGLPLIYQIAVTDTKSGTTGSSMNSQPTQEKAFVHYTRVIHIIDDVLENEVVGSPKLEVVFNRLMDLEKIVGGDAEMFWRGARPGFQGKVDKEYQLTDQMKSDLKEQIDEYEHNLRRMLVNEGVSYEALAQQIADPTQHVDIQIQMISTVTGIPKRILTGTERGELSSNQDASEWRSYVGGRRLDHAEPHIVRPFVDRCIELGILPALIGDSYKVSWSDLYAMSEAESVKIGLDRSTALKNYTSSPMAEAVVSPEGFLQYCMGFDDNQIAIIKKAANSEILKEQQLIGLFPTEKSAAADLKAKTQPKVQPIGVQPVTRTRKPIAK